SDLADTGLGEPQCAIWSHRDFAHFIRRGWRDGILGNRPSCGDASDFANVSFDEPERAIRSYSDPKWAAACARESIFSDGSACGDAPNLVAEIFSEPERAIRSLHDPHRMGIGAGEGILGDGPTCGDAPNLSCAALNEPERAVRAVRDPVWVAGHGGDIVVDNV